MRKQGTYSAPLQTEPLLPAINPESGNPAYFLYKVIFFSKFQSPLNVSSADETNLAMMLYEI
jgi:hypothetical protein